ncbi:MAG: hypothetical protein NWE98_00635 [Candidatus Bathyarchaeota archaeon]|nr:hypothetical protein [Candidatus Bathyarchaeota archaeon]
MKVSFIIVCGEKIDHPNVVYREPIGKWDAINFAAKFVPNDCSVIVLNDVDTKICNVQQAFEDLNKRAEIIYCKVMVSTGPQVKFYKILDPLRRRLHIAASGEFMLLKKSVWMQVLPVPPCIAEDSYILFRALELGYRAYFCNSTYVITERTRDAKSEEAYKERTTLGIYQALNYTKPPLWINLFYLLLPIVSPMLNLVGEDGRAWAKGIESAIKAHITNRNCTKF